MTQRKPSKDDALEALDFIISVLKEHEKDLDRLINELGIITEKLDDKGEHSQKIERVENRLSLIQTELTELIKFLSTPGEKLPQALIRAQAQMQTKSQTQPNTSMDMEAEATMQTETAKTEAAQTGFTHGPPVIVRCKQWEDFKLLAQGADTVSFLHKDAEKSFQADALKDSRVFTFNGVLPDGAKLLKTWLARELSTAEGRIFEGVLAIG